MMLVKTDRMRNIVLFVELATLGFLLQSAGTAEEPRAGGLPSRRQASKNVELAQISVQQQAGVEKKQMLDPILGRIIESNNEFAFKLYGRIAANGGNLVFSPASISIALGMTNAGAAGETEKQIAQTLRWNGSEAELHSGFGAFIRGLTKVGDVSQEDAPQLKVANQI